MLRKNLPSRSKAGGTSTFSFSVGKKFALSPGFSRRIKTAMQKEKAFIPVSCYSVSPTGFLRVCLICSPSPPPLLVPSAISEAVKGWTKKKRTQWIRRMTNDLFTNNNAAFEREVELLRKNSRKKSVLRPHELPQLRREPFPAFSFELCLRVDGDLASHGFVRHV